MKLFVFSTNLDFVIKAEKAGIDSVIIDWENKDKSKRQRGYNCQINEDSPNDVLLLKGHVNIPITVRVNQYGEYSQSEIDLAINSGADILMLPMAKKAKEVESFLKLVNARAETIIQIETLEILEDIKLLAQLPWTYAYIGLNDLMIEKHKKGNLTQCIWDTLRDGTVEDIITYLEGYKYGFGGVTIIGGGFPIKTELLLHEYVRLGCSIGLLRRSFFNEILDRNLEMEIPLIKDFLKASRDRGPKAIASDKEALYDVLNTLK